MSDAQVTCQKCGQKATASYSISQEGKDILGINNKTKLKEAALCDECASNLFDITIIPDDKPDVASQIINQITHDAELAERDYLVEKRKHIKAGIWLTIWGVFGVAAMVIIGLLSSYYKTIDLGTGVILEVLFFPIFIFVAIVISSRSMNYQKSKNKYDELKNNLAFAKEISESEQEHQR